MCLRAIKTKYYMQRVPILSILGYNIGSLVASGSTLLVLRQFYILNRLSSFRTAPSHPLATPLKGGKFDHRPERPKVLLRHCQVIHYILIYYAKAAQRLKLNIQYIFIYIYVYTLHTRLHTPRIKHVCCSRHLERTFCS